MAKILYLPSNTFLLFVSSNSQCFTTLNYSESMLGATAQEFIKICVQHQIIMNVVNRDIMFPIVESEFEIVYD